MTRLYEKLKNDEFFKDKLKIDETNDCLTITFNQYLYLDYFEGSYKSASDEGLILFRGDLTHWHIQDDGEALEIVSDFTNGDVICIETKSFFLTPRIVFMKKEKFEKEKERYMKRKFVLIYTGNAIIKECCSISIFYRIKRVMFQLLFPYR